MGTFSTITYVKQNRLLSVNTNSMKKTKQIRCVVIDIRYFFSGRIKKSFKDL